MAVNKDKKEEVGFNDDDLNLFQDITEHLESQEEVDENKDVDNNVDNENDNDDNVVNEYLDEDSPQDEDTNDEDEVDNNEDNEEEDSNDEDNDNEEELDDDTEENPSLFTPYAKLLVDEGVLSSLDLENFDGTADGLKKAMSDEIGYHVNQYKDQLPNEVKRLLDGYEAGIPFDEMLKVSSDRIKYENIKEEALSEDTNLQKNIIKDYLDKTTQLPDEIKNKMVTQWEDSMELEDQSKLALSELIKHEEQRESQAIEQQNQEREAMIKQQEKMVKELNDYVGKSDEFIPGLKVNKVVKDNIIKNLTTPVEYDQFGNPMNKVGKYMAENPIQGEVMLNYVFEITDGFKDWSAFSKKGKNDTIKEFERAAKMVDSSSKGKAAKRIKRSNKKIDTMEGINDFLRNQ